MCLIYFFYFDCELIKKKKRVFGKKTDMEWGPTWIFFVKDTKNGGNHCKKTPKMNERSGDFCYRNGKNRSTPLLKGQIYLKLGDFLFLTIGYLREPSDGKDFCEGLNFGRLFFLHPVLNT